MENLKYLRLAKNTQVLEYLSMDLLMGYEEQHLKVMNETQIPVKEEGKN